MGMTKSASAGALFGKTGPQFFPHQVNALSINVAVGPGKINVFEDAERRLDFGKWAFGMNPVFVDQDHLAGIDVADVSA